MRLRPHRRALTTLAATLAAALLPLGACARPATAPDAVVPATPTPPRAETKAPEPAAFDGGTPLRVAGGAALGCEAKAAGEWVRLSCRGLAYTGGLPWRVTVHGAEGARAQREEELGNVALIWRHTPGTDLSASFVWYPHVFRFRAHWPGAEAGADVEPRPEVLGAFVGAPGERTSSELIRAVCACPPRQAPALLLPPRSCESPTVDAESFEPWDPACVRQLVGAEGCQNVNECLTSEPSSFKSCAEDELRSGPPPFAGCFKTCDAGAPCPHGFACKPSEVITPSDDVGPGPTACFATDEAHNDYLQSLQKYLEAAAAR